MKKHMIRILAMLSCLILFSLPALAETELPDLSVYTDEEIIALSRLLNQEFADRKIAKTADLAPGTYYAGKDLPVGTYIFCGKAEGNDWGSMTVYSMKDGTRDDQKVWEVVSADDPCECMITLEVGDQLKCAVPFQLTVYTGVVFR